jgi:CDP-glycerol glycerophosphotransferase (TagB/SpsB family)
MVVRAVELRLRSSADIVALFDQYKPALVLGTMILDGDINVPLLREARRRGVATAGMVRSWDNLTTYGFVRVLPDHFFAQNQFIKDMAQSRHDISAKRISVVGLPHYDAYTHHEGLPTRDEFAKGLELDPNKKIILYAAVGDFLFPSEATLAPILNDVAGARDMQVIFRAHPAHDSAAKQYGDLPHMRFDRSVTYRSESYNDWDMNQSQELHLMASLYHCDVLVTASGTSMLVDAAVFNKPLISIKFDGSHTEPYWFSIARFFDHADHSKVLLATDGTEVVTTKEQLASALDMYESNPSYRAEGRSKILGLLAAPLGGACERLASGVLALLA